MSASYNFKLAQGTIGKKKLSIGVKWFVATDNFSGFQLEVTKSKAQCKNRSGVKRLVLNYIVALLSK